MEMARKGKKNAIEAHRRTGQITGGKRFFFAQGVEANIDIREKAGIFSMPCACSPFEARKCRWWVPERCPWNGPD